MKKTAVEQVKREADNEKYARNIRDMMHVVADDVRRTVAQSTALKSMEDEQARQVHTLYFKSCVANLINKCEPVGDDDPMVAVREQLLREVAQKEALLAQENEQMRRTIEEFKHTVSEELRRKVARKSAGDASALEQAQRVVIDNLHEISDEIRRTVAAAGASQAVAVEQAQQIQADYFKRMVAGHLANNQEITKENHMKAVQDELLAEVTPAKSLSEVE